MSAVLQAEIKAYAGLIKVGAVVVLLLLTFLSGCHEQKKRDQTRHDHDVTALANANASLEAAAQTLKAVNDQAAKALAQARASEKAVMEAGVAASAAERAAQQQADAFKKRLEKASKVPACKSLLDMNIGAACALSSH